VKVYDISLQVLGHKPIDVRWIADISLQGLNIPSSPSNWGKHPRESHPKIILSKAMGFLLGMKPRLIGRLLGMG